jgi:hypothetical protein
MNNNHIFELTNDTMTYAEYINRFTLIHSIKKSIVKLNFPLDEIPYLSLMSEEELFMRQWDINNFGFNKVENNVLCKMWIDKETNKFTESTLMVN